VTAFAYVDGELCAERLPLTAVAARFGTPCYVYSRAALEGNFRAFDSAFADLPHLVCYAIKANSNLAILDLFARLGSGFDIVSGGELARVLAAGGDPAKIVFSGVGKTEAEMEAALAAGILCFNVESAAELEALAAVAGRLGRNAPVSFRVNPDVDPRTHPYIATGLKESKFGLAFADAPALYRRAAAMPHVAVRGIDIHIGSQITELEPYREAAAKVLDLVDRLAAEGIALHHIDLGGGLGIRYRDETPVPLADYAAMVRALFRGRRERLLFEPGRRLVGDAGVLLTRVSYLKPGRDRAFAIVDAAMNDLLRPALYDAWHPVDPVRPRTEPPQRWNIVGPVCESGDFLAHERELALAAGDVLAIGAAGAYGFVMSSNYNTRPRAAEVIVDKDRAHLVRPRETVAELYARESPLPPD
jgi:diaminopimelate decarboxylase